MTSFVIGVGYFLLDVQKESPIDAAQGDRQKNRELVSIGFSFFDVKSSMLSEPEHVSTLKL